MLLIILFDAFFGSIPCVSRFSSSIFRNAIYSSFLVSRYLKMFRYTSAPFSQRFEFIKKTTAKYAIRN